MIARLDVALDARMTSHMSEGMKAYARELLGRLPAVAPELRFASFGSGDNFDLAEQVGIPLALARRRPRLAHFLSPYTPRLIPVPYVVTIQDLIDLRFPQFAKAKVQPYYRFGVGPIVRGARAVVVPDGGTRDDLVRILRVAPERIRVVPLGVEEGFGDDATPAANGRPYFLYAGNHRPHKDLATLFTAWHELPSGSGIDLYVTGDDDFGGRLDGYARGDGRIVCLGDVPRAELAKLYRGARAYVHPALLEGFGLPLLEAMWVGTPVIASAASVPEPLRAHALTFPPGNADALRRLLTRALFEPGELARRGTASRGAARALTWDRCARATADVYRELLGA